MTAPASATLGTPLSPHATRVLLLGAGELGKEVAIELQRFGVEVIAADRYGDAPAMQVAHRCHTLNMLDPAALRDLIAHEKPDIVVPEIEAIHTPTLVELEAERGQRVIPTARAARLTMDREGIRRLAAETLGLPTSPYRFVDSREEYLEAVRAIGLPCVVKPVMSSSGKGQSTVRSEADIDTAWDHAQTGGRAGQGRCIVEGFVDFEYEITLLTVRHRDGVAFCDPIGHLQVAGDYRESWMPQPMSAKALERARGIAATITGELGGWGVFGVELFVRGDEVWFSEVSPRPHDTGMVTMIGQELSQFALHARAILGLPIPNIATLGPAASCAVLAEGHGVPVFSNVDAALAEPDTALRLFGKPRVEGQRRVAVTLARAADVDGARGKARRGAAALGVALSSE
ncbi:formate-dependent phosphoribosylglycinamide formyltransferase [Arenimonas composti]|uniref:Formate-dependent phosphoribosylglycinamide formyltransferase n=1 Tax=Arenimonas composti TR7-09 = DSM 18010 TaxID=1121013 RepID=A0A091BZE5_9GAMM|nr:formate-dependent phosphoribosylglycinamide formyltransferase [Arenimonas composti]KFN49740.1 phosphoribosylglycinamide formyltransferase [Arenimonas composti TR7-09 = DSM 18010]